MSGPRERFAFVAFTIAAALLYFVGVPDNPPGFYIDESSIAFNASTIAQHGSDEFGVRWPLYFRAFGDYKNPVYVYLLAALFRLTSESILVARLFSSVLGVFAAALLGLLAVRLTRNRSIGWLIAAMTLLTPWLFEASRVVLEVALYPLALGLFLLCLQRASEKARWSRLQIFALSGTLALLTYSYSIGRLLGPLFALGLLFFCNRERWLSVIRTWCTYGVWLIPLIIFNDTHPGALMQRFKIVTYLTPQSHTGETVRDFAGHYLANLDLRRLLISGDPNRDQITHIFGTPHFLAATFVLAAVGLVLVIRRHMHDPWWRFVLYGLAASIVPASLTNEHFHMLRLIALPVFLLVFTIPGVVRLTENAATRIWRLVLVVLLVLTVTQAAAFQWKFHHSASLPRRLKLFDAQYRDRIFAPAIASNQRPIYLADALAIPGYIQADWNATLAHLDRSQFVLLPSDKPPPTGALVITTEENCPRCEILAHVKPYTLYVAIAPPRERVPLPPDGFRAELSILDPPKKIQAGKRAKLRVRVKNTSAATWLARERSGGKLQVSVGNHWLNLEGKTVVGDDGRSALLQDLPPGEEMELRLTVNAPRARGDYILEVDMLQENVAWFGLKDSPTEKLRMQVE